MKKKRIWMGLVEDHEYWKAVEEMPDSIDKFSYYICSGEPMLSILIRHNKVKGYPKIKDGLAINGRGNHEV